MAESILIVGASVRAAAQSAARAGLRVTAVDLFGDEDLRACAGEVHVVAREKYPHGLADVAAALPPSPWMYTGGLENYPDLVARISERHELLGNGPEVLRAVRDPFRMAEVLRSAGCDVLPVCRSPREIPPGETWLKKPLRSSGGELVRFVRPEEATDERTPARYYYQRYQTGIPASAAFVASGGRAVLVGVSEQLLGDAWGAPAPFMYAGSIGSLELPSSLQSQLEQLGDVLAAQFRLVGLFGVDGVLVGESFWPVEINPRYTASLEIYERARGESLIAAHVAACQHGLLPTEYLSPRERCHGKAILYAPSAGVISSGFVASLGEAVADIPAPGTPFRAGEPICTLFTSGADANAVRAFLATQIRSASNLLNCGQKS